MGSREAAEENLLHIWSTSSVSSAPVQTKGQHNQGINTNKPLGASISQGRTVYEYAKMCIGEEAMSHTVQGAFRFPRNFWPSCCRLCFKRESTKAFNKSLKKSFNLYTSSLRKGANTDVGLRLGRSAKQKKSTLGGIKKQKCPEVGQLLFDWFVDCIHNTNARVNNA